MHDFSYEAAPPPERTRVVIGPLGERLIRMAETGCLLVEETLLPAHGEALRALVAHVIREPAAPIVLSGGEAVKAPAVLHGLWRELLARDLRKDSLLVVAGGGAMLDACGFAGATFLRGVDVMNVPTTFLAQIDAGIGGKCALNLEGAKNQVGVIRQPRCVAVDPAFLAALPDAPFRSGLGELAKTALLEGALLHDLVLCRAPAILARDQAVLTEVLFHALAFKAGVVARDPMDGGRRLILNAGHSVGHVFEAEALRRGLALSHGEAVAIGLSTEAGAHRRADAAAVRRVLEALSLPARAPFRIDVASARTLLGRDKKSSRDEILIPVIEAPGKVACEWIGTEALAAAIAGA